MVRCNTLLDLRHVKPTGRDDDPTVLYVSQSSATAFQLTGDVRSPVHVSQNFGSED